MSYDFNVGILLAHFVRRSSSSVHGCAQGDDGHSTYRGGDAFSECAALSVVPIGTLAETSDRANTASSLCKPSLVETTCR